MTNTFTFILTFLTEEKNGKFCVCMLAKCHGGSWKDSLLITVFPSACVDADFQPSTVSVEEGFCNTSRGYRKKNESWCYSELQALRSADTDMNPAPSRTGCELMKVLSFLEIHFPSQHHRGDKSIS